MGLAIPTEFGDSITADHKVMSDFDQSRNQDRAACIALDRATHCFQGYPAPQKSRAYTKLTFQAFLGPKAECKHAYTDNSGEFTAALKELDIPHDNSRPHRPASNGQAERCVRKVVEGTSVQLVQSGFAYPWWCDAMFIYCFLANAHDTLLDGKTSYENRWGKPFTGPKYPMGCHVRYLPSSQADKAKCHPLGSKLLDGLHRNLEATQQANS